MKRNVEIESKQALADHLQQGSSLDRVVLQGLDLTDFAKQLLLQQVDSTVFLGCKMPPELLQHAYTNGALIVPEIPGKPFPSCPSGLYSVEDLFASFDPDRPQSYSETLDATVYRHWQQTGGPNPQSILETLARRLHDHGITDALQDLLQSELKPKVVAIMGGHGMSRSAPAYRQVARIARRLTQRGFLLASGGGPGAMEATHLGAYLAGREPGDLEAALKILAQHPEFSADQTGQWLAPAFRVRQRYPLSQRDKNQYPSLGIPTWLYGHEPPNAFATHIAKYFANSVREEGLLAIATYGVIYSPGSAGTIQEVFQDCCQNHYKTMGVVSPMVFLDSAYWTQKKPIYPLLESLAKGQEYGRFLSITDSVETVVQQIENYDTFVQSGGC